ncbi:MAG: FKBP-type peptidyl-prolyl cis-trans isomerase [Myxococcota bacterium]
MLTSKPPRSLVPVPGKLVKTDSGLEYMEQVVGKGERPTKGQKVIVHYSGWLLKGRDAQGKPKKGKMFDSSYRRGEPFHFALGTGGVIKGWDEGVASMKVGGKRTLIVPAKLGYGSRSMTSIPPNSTLVFEVALLGIKKK